MPAPINSISTVKTSTPLGLLQEAVVKIATRKKLPPVYLSVSNFVEVGRFVILELKYEDPARKRAIKAVGIARRGQGEPRHLPGVGIGKAVSRACDAIILKIENKFITDPLMG